MDEKRQRKLRRKRQGRIKPQQEQMESLLTIRNRKYGTSGTETEFSLSGTAASTTSDLSSSASSLRCR